MTKKSISKLIEETARALWEQGYSFDTAIMQPRSARQLAEEYTFGPGVAEVAEIVTEFGAIKILTSPYCPPETIYLGKEENLRGMAELTAKLYEYREDIE